jgi:transcriptional regulator with XRE-family HTH domain
MVYLYSTMDSTTHPGERIREARQRRGLNKNQLARALGTSWQHLDNWEKGRVEPSLSSVRRLAEVLEVSADYLLGLREMPSTVSAIEEFLKTLAPADLSEREEHWLRNAPVEHEHLRAEDYEELLASLRHPSSRAAKSGARPKIDRHAIAKKIAEGD